MLIEQLAQVHAPELEETSEILTPEALSFLGRLEQEFGPRRRMMLQRRSERQALLNDGQRPEFLSATAWIRDEDWQVAPIPNDLQNRRVEITGPTDAKMMINALNSGANVFMADFEDANCPTWTNLIQGQANIRQAIAGTLRFSSPEGKKYQLNKKTAVLMVRPRGWHLEESHVEVDGKSMSASLFDFGLFVFHNAQTLLEKGSGPYLYLPKLENHLEARLWNEVFDFAEQELGLPHGCIKCTVLIETILAAFEMEEILYELREHIVGLNAGRWDYIFSIIKKLRRWSAALMPDRHQVTMTVPFMRAYTELLVQTCHKRGAHAMGGMAAFIPSRKDVEVNETALAKVREDKSREVADGFDGTWVAHPDLVPVAREVFDQALGDEPHQKDNLREDVSVTSRQLLHFDIEGGRITPEGIRANINVALQYLAAWLNGQGAVAINNLMEDTATAEISRAQLWQWLHHPEACMADGSEISKREYCKIMIDEMERLESVWPQGSPERTRLRAAAELLDQLALDDDFEDFLTIPAQEALAELNGGEA